MCVGGGGGTIRTILPGGLATACEGSNYISLEVRFLRYVLTIFGSYHLYLIRIAAATLAVESTNCEHVLSVRL